MPSPPPKVAQFDALMREGNALRAAGRVHEAIDCYRRAVALAPHASAAHYNLGIALREARQWRASVLAFRAAARADPADHEAVQNVVITLARAVSAEPAPIFGPAPASAAEGRTPVSIAVCSVREERLATMQRSFTQALGARPHEFLIVRDARSLCEGYQRALAAARHGIVVFAHDDVELLSARAFEALEHALERHDVVGVVGSTVVNGPAVTWAGHPHIHGLVAYPAQGDGFTASVYGLECGVLAGMHALDGLLFAARREAALAVGFDADTFDGFHFYDLDFTYRAHLAGLSVAVSTDVTALHASAGSYDAGWRRDAQRFCRKFALPETPQGPHHWYGARLATRALTARFYDEFRALAAVSA